MKVRIIKTNEILEKSDAWIEVNEDDQNITWTFDLKLPALKINGNVVSSVGKDVPSRDAEIKKAKNSALSKIERQERIFLKMAEMIRLMSEDFSKENGFDLDMVEDCIKIKFPNCKAKFQVGDLVTFNAYGCKEKIVGGVKEVNYSTIGFMYSCEDEGGCIYQMKELFLKKI